MSTHESKCKKAYDSFPKRLAGQFLPRGAEQAENVILSISRILDINLDECEDYHIFLSIYFWILSSMFIDKKDELVIYDSLQKYSGIIPTPEHAQYVFGVCIAIYDDNRFCLNDETDSGRTRPIVFSLQRKIGAREFAAKRWRKS